ncbi:unnamed protein product [Mortierella alpina]
MSMADIFVIVLFSLLVVSKGAVLLYLFHKRCSKRSAVQTTGPEVLVEDPMTQRIALGEQFGSSSTSLDITLPPPAYTIKDQHLEFADDPRPLLSQHWSPAPSHAENPVPPFLVDRCQAEGIEVASKRTRQTMHLLKL